MTHKSSHVEISNLTFFDSSKDQVDSTSILMQNKKSQH